MLNKILKLAQKIPGENFQDLMFTGNFEKTVMIQIMGFWWEIILNNDPNYPKFKLHVFLSVERQKLKHFLLFDVFGNGPVSIISCSGPAWVHMTQINTSCSLSLLSFVFLSGWVRNWCSGALIQTLIDHIRQKATGFLLITQTCSWPLMGRRSACLSEVKFESSHLYQTVKGTSCQRRFFTRWALKMSKLWYSEALRRGVRGLPAHLSLCISYIFMNTWQTGEAVFIFHPSFLCSPSFIVPVSVCLLYLSCCATREVLVPWCMLWSVKSLYGSHCLISLFLWLSQDTVRWTYKGTSWWVHQPFIYPDLSNTFNVWGLWYTIRVLVESSINF